MNAFFARCAAVMALVALWVGYGTGAEAASASQCLSAGTGPAADTVILIDKTTPKEASAVTAFRRSALAAAQPGRRVVVAVFAGMARGETPTIRLDVYVPPVPTADERFDLPVNLAREADACYRRARSAVVNAVEQAVSELTEDGSGEYSELLYAFHWVAALNQGTRPLRLVVFSDGWLHSADGSTFYSSGSPRQINPEAELKRAQSWLTRPERVHRDSEVALLGAGAQPLKSARHVNPALQIALEKFWADYFRATGYRRARVSLALPD